MDREMERTRDTAHHRSFEIGYNSFERGTYPRNNVSNVFTGKHNVLKPMIFLTGATNTIDEYQTTS